MSETSRGFVKYTSRDYSSLVDDFWSAVPTLTELWRPEADADPGVVLGKFLASAADMLGVNLDLLANEVFASSVSQRKNAEKLFGLIGYELGWYTAARTEVTFTNNTQQDMRIDFGFNGNNFSTLNAYTDITNQSRVITYNILPRTSTYGDSNSRSSRSIVTDNPDVFSDTDLVLLKPGQSATRIAIEGELRHTSVSVDDVLRNNLIIKLPSQHVDTTAVWIRAKSSKDNTDVNTQWIQCSSPAEFIQPEPRFAVTYDSYSNAQIQVSNYLSQLENYRNNYLTIYWIDCSGVIGCVGEDVLSNLMLAKPNQGISESGGDLIISNLSNTVELPHTYTVTGRSPETAKEAYYSSRNYINTFDSLVTLPDYNRFLNRTAGVDCGVVLDCQKALEINLAIYNDKNLSDDQKQKMYITKYDFPEGRPVVDDWGPVLSLPFNPSDPNAFVFSTNFQTYTAMCFAIHNDFKSSSWGRGQIATAQINKKAQFTQYKPPARFIDAVKRDFRPLQAMSVDIQFGYVRVFPFYVVGQIFPKKPVSADNAANIVAIVKEALALYFAPSNRQIGVLPTIMEIVNVIQSSCSDIAYFDAGSVRNPVINWLDCDPSFFNAISFSQYVPDGGGSQNIRIHPSYIIDG